MSGVIMLVGLIRYENVPNFTLNLSIYINMIGFIHLGPQVLCVIRCPRSYPVAACERQQTIESRIGTAHAPNYSVTISVKEKGVFGSTRVFEWTRHFGREGEEAETQMNDASLGSSFLPCRVTL